MDVVLLSRLQFALTIMFHYLFPPLTIGLGVVLVFLEGAVPARPATRSTRSRPASGRRSSPSTSPSASPPASSWSSSSAPTGPTYSRFVGDVFGSALAAEGIFAFFLESGFLAVLVFGWDRVSPRMHFFATLHGRAGLDLLRHLDRRRQLLAADPGRPPHRAVLRDGSLVIDGQPVLRAEITDFWAMVFNPSTVHRLVHVWIGAFILGAFFVMSISAYYLLRGRHEEFARRSLHRRPAVRDAGLTRRGSVSGHFQAADGGYRTSRPSWPRSRAHFQTGPGAP